MAKTPTLKFKRGDDFKLDLTVTDTNNTTAIAAAKTLATAQLAYDTALAAVPQDPVLVGSTKTDLDAAQAAYDAAIVVDITGWTITSQMAWCGKPMATFSVMILDAAAGTFSISAAAADTQLWIPRTYDADIQFIRTQGKVSSETFAIEVLKDITYG